MTAITSQTFHVEPALPRVAHALADVLRAGGQLLAHAWAATADSQLLARAWAATADSQPKPEAADLEQVRSLARAWEKTDPGFAADLYAAAARHEALND